MSGRRLDLELQPAVLRWARERAGLTAETLAKKVGTRPERVREWETNGQITMAQVDKLAHHTRTPLGFLFLEEAAEDELPIPDFRTSQERPPVRPSLELLDTIRAMQRRQDWMRDELIELGNDPLPFVGSASLDSPPEEVAQRIRTTVGLESGWAHACRTWSDALRLLRDRIGAAGVLVVSNGVVANNTHRRLDPAEFRGFALVDEYAPLVFINGADFVSAQMFTLVHELVHVWVGAGGVSNFEAMQPLPHRVERFCNAVAAEVLVPAVELRAFWAQLRPGVDAFTAVAREFKVSTIVAARRALDLGMVTRDEFFAFHQAWQESEHNRKQRASDSGNFWNNQNVRVGHRFGLAVVRAVKEDRLLFRDAFSLTGLKGKTFDTFVQQMEAEL